MSKKKKQEKLLYHYTSKAHLLDILASGYIKRSPSDLVAPTKLEYDVETNSFVGDTDDIRPVVWLTSNPYATQEELGTYQQVAPEKRKDTVRIAVTKTADMKSWLSWHTSNHGDERTAERFKATALDWMNWYVCERDIPVEEFVEVMVDGEEVVGI